MIDVDKAITTAVKSGKVVFGATEALRGAKTGKARLIVMASNTRSDIRESLEYYGKLSQVPVVIYRGNSYDLGVVSGKPFAVTTLTVKESGDSDILKWAETPETEVIKEEVEES